MRALLLEQRVLALNASWQGVGTKSPIQALKDMAADAFLGMVIEGEQMYPVGWEEWLKLPPLDDVYCIRTQKRTFRLPTVIISKHYHKMPVKRPTLTREALFRRDRLVCGYSGRKLSLSEASVDHIHPESRGGKWEWDNLITAHRDINQKKGNLTNDEAGLRLQFAPKVPKPLPVTFFIQNPFKVPGWETFLNPK